MNSCSCCFHLKILAPGSDDDSRRICEFLKLKGADISDIFVTLDSHHKIHIAHAVCWRNADGHHPSPFTLISNKEIEDGVWLPTELSLLDHYKFYTKELEAKGRFKLIIWPDHCLIGTPGHAVYPPLNEALQEWAGTKLNTINYIMKGSNCLTEMYR